MEVEFSDKDLDSEVSEEEEEEEEEEETLETSRSRKKNAKEHKTQLERLKEKDPEFYQFLQEHDKELLDFNDEDIEEDTGTDVEDGQSEEFEGQDFEEKDQESSKKVITTAMVDSWCNAVCENGKIGAIRSLMKAFRIACHYGDDTGDEASSKFSIMSSSVFNKIMLFVLSEMDGIIRNMLGLPASGGKKETVIELMNSRKWKKYSHLVKSYLGNALHVLNQMTDTEMISFTLRRLKYSSVLLAAFPSLLRKYIKVALHFWGTGGGALPVVSFLFLRDLCIRLGSGCLDECIKGIYKAYVLNCQFVNATKLSHIQFLGNCVIELLGVDLSSAYQHAFIFIRQLATILRDAITMKTKESFRKVYEWKYMNCLELWTGAVCAYSSGTDFQPLAYPLCQIISGVGRLVPTARYFPLRLRCVKMLNRIAASTGSFIPVSMLLLDMLEMKELNRPPTGGVGTAVDLRTVLKVSKPVVKTRAFQEACVYSVVDEVAEHLAQWSYSVAFFELSFIPAVRLRAFCKYTKVDRFRKEMRRLIRQIENNSQFINESRKSVTFLPNDPAATSFLEDEKKSGSSPLSLYVTMLRRRAQQRIGSLTESSVLVGETSSTFGNKLADSDEDDDTMMEKGTAAFSSSWLPGGQSNIIPAKEEKEEKKTSKKKKKRGVEKQGVASEEDVVEDLVLSSDEDDGSMSDTLYDDEDDQEEKPVISKRSSKKRKSRSKKSNLKSSGNDSQLNQRGDGTKPVFNAKQRKKKPKKRRRHD